LRIALPNNLFLRATTASTRRISTFSPQTERRHFSQHPHTVLDEADFASFVVIPAHGDFAQPKSGLLREVKQFDVKGEAIQLRPLKDWPAPFQTESFESTLCVPKRQPGCDSHEKIKNSPGLFPSPWLAIPDQTPIKRARTERDINFSGGDWFDQFRRLAERR
jgi:hypothetical protein